MPTETDSKSVAVLKALADPIRLEMLTPFVAGDEVQCGEIQSNCPRSQPTVSHHLARLVESGLLIEQKEGTQKSYRLNRALLDELGIDLKRLLPNPS